MTGTVTLYSQTHFNGIDIPAGPEVLQYAPVVSILNDVYFERMDVDLDHIDLKIQYSSVRDVDYIKLHNNQDNIDFYYRAIPTALAKGTTRMLLKLDALMTLGGPVHINYISGWQERGHIAKADDTLFSNVAAENWVPTQELECVNTTPIKPTAPNDQIKRATGSTYEALNDDLTVAVSNIDLSLLGENQALTIDVIEGIVSGAVDPSMYLPALKIVRGDASSTFIIHDYTSNPSEHSFFIPNTAAFITGGASAATYGTDINKIKWGLELLYSCGQLQLQASYQIPKDYVDKVIMHDNKAGVIQYLKGNNASVPLSNLAYEYTIPNYTVKNKKCYATYRTYAIASLASGDLIVKKPSELYQSGTLYPTVNIWADPCSTGKPYCRFSYIKGNPIIWEDSVRGLQWQSAQIVMEGASGSVWNSLNTGFANQLLSNSQALQFYQNTIALAKDQLDVSDLNNKAQVNNFKEMTGTLDDAGNWSITRNSDGSGKSTSSTGSPFAALKHVADISLNEATFYNDLQRKGLDVQSRTADHQFRTHELMANINQNNVGLLKNNSVVAPSVSFTPEQNLGLYGYNYFIGYEVRKSIEDLKSEDMYYQRYGYNGLHRPLTQQCFKEREHYNYVQAFDVNLKPANGISLGARVEAAAIAQLNGGVRVWRDQLPNPAAYDTN